MAGFLDEAELAEDGTVKGLDDEIKKLVEGKDTAFLFDRAGTKFKGAKSAEKGDGGGDSAMTLEKLKAMTPLIAITLRNHPDEYKNCMEVLNNA